MPPLFTNRFLEALRVQTGLDLAAQCEAVPLPLGSVLYEPAERPRYVHFITSGVASMVATMHTGNGVEVGMSGYEGFPESVFLLGPETGTKRCMMQVDGSALRMSFQRFEKLFFSDSALQRIALRLVQYESFVLGQLTACNGLHDMEERLARWLLMTETRAGSPDLPLTQEFLSQMLGTRRSTVTLTAGNFQRSGLIDYRRGHIKVRERDRLKEVACECYDQIQRLYENIYR